MADGTYEAEAIATNSPGVNTTSIPVAFTIDTVSPAVSITAPANGSASTDNQPTIVGTAGTARGDGGTIRRHIPRARAQAPLEALTTTAKRRFLFRRGQRNAADGVYTAQARRSDWAGNIGYSNVVTFTIRYPGPGRLDHDPGQRQHHSRQSTDDRRHGGHRRRR